MKHKFTRLLVVFSALYGLTQVANAQFVSIINKNFVVNGSASCPIYFNGANTPWDKWNDFGSNNYSTTFWSSHFKTLKDNGLNSTRIWFTCNGAGQPSINANGVTTGANTKFWQDCDHLFQQAEANGIYVMATVMSFDHTKENNIQSANANNWRAMLNSEANVKSYVDNFVVPFVNRYKTNPYLFSIDACNEIEWIYENRNSSIANDKNWSGATYAILQRYVAMVASGVHNNPRTDGSTVLVTLGSAATKWNATKMRDGANGTGWKNNGDGNKWSDAALKAQYNQANAVLDYYSPHYYSWIDQWYSNPFEKSPTDFGMDEKPCLIGETPAGNPGTPNLQVLASYEALRSKGWLGHFPWTSNGVDNLGNISKFGADALAFTNAHTNLVRPNCPITEVTDYDSQNNGNGLVYPNPFSSEGLNIQRQGEFLYHITDISGSVVEQGNGHDTKTVGTRLLAGIYLLSIDHEQGRTLQKIVKK